MPARQPERKEIYMADDDRRLALLIDAENISAQYADYIIDEVANYGVCSYKRIYGSWDRIVHTKWENEINKNSLKPMMQFNNTRGKNATDSALIIDAMDILYRGTVDGFVIVSSDSDFTSLARRLTEAGKMVIGMGESDKATTALENAYDKFIYIDLLARQAEEEAAEERRRAEAERRKARSAKKQEHAADKREAAEADHERGTANTPSKKQIEESIRQIIMENDDKSRETDLGQIGQELGRMYKNFDVRYYSMKGGRPYKYLKEFVSDFKSLALETTADYRVYVRLRR